MQTMAAANSSGVNSPTLAAEAVDSQSCSEEHQQCGKLHWCSWSEVPCCGSMRCEQLLGGSGKVCVPLESQCVAANGVCGGSGQLTLECCGNAVCQKMFGGDQMKCVEPACVPANGVCGGPGQLTQECCGNAVCQRLLGGTQMQCVEPAPQSCVPANGVCGGLGQLTRECCGNAVCQTMLGGSQMQCVEAALQSLRGSKVATANTTSTSPPPAVVQTTAATNSSGVDSPKLAAASMDSQSCAGEHEQCGKLQWWSWSETPCCGNMRCEQLLGGSGKVCVPLDSQCVPENEICGGPGQLTQECCGNAVCQKLFGGDQMKCVESAPQPCWSFNGGTCVNVHGAGPETTCYRAFNDCYQASSGASCWSWNGAICVSVVGAAVSQCYESEARCHALHR